MESCVIRTIISLGVCQKHSAVANLARRQAKKLAVRETMANEDCQKAAELQNT
jgi:hypothetical protein